MPEDKQYTLEPTLKMNDAYCYNQSHAFHFDTEKPIATEEKEGISRKLKSLEQAL